MTNQKTFKLGHEEPPRRYTDVSIHFKFDKENFDSVKERLDEVLEERTMPDSVIHHCFMPREKVVRLELDETLCDAFDELTKRHNLPMKCWNDNKYGDINGCREAMLSYIKSRNGLCIFIGEIQDGVATEFKMCRNEKCNFMFASATEPQSAPNIDYSNYPDWFKQLGKICEK